MIYIYIYKTRLYGKRCEKAIELFFMPCIIYLSIHTFLKIDSHFQKTSDFYYYRSDVKTINRYTILRDFEIEGILIRTVSACKNARPGLSHPRETVEVIHSIKVVQ